MEMQLDGQLGAFFHIIHGGRSGDGSGCSTTGQRLVICGGASL